MGTKASCDRCSKGAAKANLFKIESGYSIPVVHAVEDNIEVRLKGVDAGKDYLIEVFHPGVKEAVVIQGKPEGEDYILNVPVIRNCAMVHLKKI